MYFAADRLFNAFTGFQKARQRRIITRRETRLPPDQCLALKFSQHDDDRVSARKMFLLAIAAFAAPAGAEQHSRRAAASAETVAIMPFDKAACSAVNRSVFGWQH